MCACIGPYRFTVSLGASKVKRHAAHALNNEIIMLAVCLIAENIAESTAFYMGETCGQKSKVSVRRQW